MPTPPVHDPTDAGSRLAGAARLGALTAGVIALALGALGCGGGGGSTSAQAVTMTKAEFVAKANAICAKDDPQLSEASAKLAALHTPAEVTAAWLRQDRRCRDCGRGVPRDLVEGDHIIAWSAGGADDPAAARDHLRELAEVGVTWATTGFSAPDRAGYVDRLRRYGDEVIAKLR